MADEKKRIIDLSELSQEVQVGQYIIVDSASGPGKMNLKKIVDDSTTSLAERVTNLETGLTEEENARIADDTELAGNVSNLQTALETKADNDGYYPDLYAGNLSSTKKQTDSTPYLMRKTGGDLSRIGEREDDTLVGATVNVNQLVDIDTSSVTIQSGHKYYAKISGTESIGASTGTAISVTGGTDMVIDLTAKFGSTIADYLYSLEQTTAGAGVAKLREWGFLTDEYIPYNAGSLESVEATAHKMVGFNQFDGELVAGYWAPSTGAFVGGGANWKACKNYIKCVPNTAYAYLATGSGNSKGSIVFYDASKNFISAISGGTGAGVSLFTTPSNCRYFTFYLSTAFSDNICINISNPERNGEYEPYSAHTYDLGTDTLRGLFKLDSENRLYADGDTKSSYGTVTRKYGTRAYQSGDESLADAITDGTNTVYKLTTPTTEQSTPFQNPQICDPDGTEEYVTSNGVPVGHATEYDYDIKGLAEELIDVPDVPSSNGTYVLKATRTASGLSYNWVTG